MIQSSTQGGKFEYITEGRDSNANYIDKKLISKTGYCLHCLTLREAEIKYDGLWNEYEDYKIHSNMIAYGNDVLAQFKQAYRDAKQTYEVVQEDGKIETWSMERDVEELKAEIEKYINSDFESSEINVKIDDVNIFKFK